MSEPADNDNLETSGPRTGRDAGTFKSFFAPDLVF